MPLVKVVPHSIRLAEIFRKLAMHYCRHSGAGVPNLLNPFLVGEMVTGGIGKERNEESQASKNSKCHKARIRHVVLRVRVEEAWATGPMLSTLPAEQADSCCQLCLRGC